MSDAPDALEIDEMIVTPDAVEIREAWTRVVGHPQSARLLREGVARRSVVDALASWVVAIPWAATLLRLSLNTGGGRSELGQLRLGTALAGLAAARLVPFIEGEVNQASVALGEEITLTPPLGYRVFAMAGESGWARPIELHRPFAWRVDATDVPLLMVVTPRQIASGADLGGERFASVLIDVS